MTQYDQADDAMYLSENKTHDENVLSFAKWVMKNYDDNGFEELHNRAKDVVSSVLNKMRGV